MKKRHDSPFAFVAIGFIILLLWCTACATLQHQKGYENYTRNEIWEQKK